MIMGQGIRGTFDRRQGFCPPANRGPQKALAATATVRYRDPLIRPALIRLSREAGRTPHLPEQSCARAISPRPLPAGCSTSPSFPGHRPVRAGLRRPRRPAEAPNPSPGPGLMNGQVFASNLSSPALSTPRPVRLHRLRPRPAGRTGWVPPAPASASSAAATGSRPGCTRWARPGRTRWCWSRPTTSSPSTACASA
jgi:hypothetical protein